MKNNMYKKNRGFTLIEMMVSVAIFAIIMTTGMGALVSMVQKYKVSQSEKQAADSLGFVLETLTREMRLGTHYYSKSEGPSTSGHSNDGEFEGDDGYIIGFDAADRRGYMVYFLEKGVLYRTNFKEDGSEFTDPLTDSSQVIIKAARVRVMNAEDSDDQKQPLVWIQFLAHPPKQETTKVIQTLVSQRVLDA